MTLIGQPETVFEVDGGSIFVDFQKGEGVDVEMDADDDCMVPRTPHGVMESPANSQLRDFLKTHPLNRGTPLTIKKNKVARIQVCEIRFNRTRASFNAALKKEHQVSSPTFNPHAKGLLKAG